jgi:hypothetical protein
MYNNKFNWILTGLIAASVFFYACPTEEEEPPESPPDFQAQATAALNVAKPILDAAELDGGTFTNLTTTGFSPHNVKFVLSYKNATLPDKTQINITHVALGNETWSNKSVTGIIGENKTSTSITLDLDSFIEKTDVNAAWNGSISFAYIAKSTGDATVESGAATFSVGIKDGVDRVVGTLNALKDVVKHFPAKGELINSGGGSVNTLNAGSVGTLVAGTSAGDFVILNKGAIGVKLNNNGGTFVAGSIGTLAALHGNLSITAGSQYAGSIAVNDFTIEKDSGGTLIVRDIGSIGTLGGDTVGGTGLATVYFGTASTKNDTHNLVLSAGGIKYIVPQFGVLVTINR